jgi:hypothetical protein
MMVITAIRLGNNPISWAKTNDNGDFAVASMRAELVNQAVNAPIN